MAKPKRDKPAGATSPENRGKSGRFRPGVSGNPGGRPRDEHGIGELARAHGPRALERLVGLIGSKNERVALAACVAVLDRGYGKPTQALEHSGGIEVERSPWTENEFARRVAFTLQTALRRGQASPESEA